LIQEILKFQEPTYRFIGRVAGLETTPYQPGLRPEVDGHDISGGLDDVRRRVSSTEDAKRRRPRQIAVVYLTHYITRYAA